MGADNARVYLALGSNLGDRHGRLIEAVERLQAHIAIDAISSIYQTEPWGYADQPRFLNAACSGTTDLSPEDVLAFAKSIEVALGREPTFRYGPRAIDLDILLYDNVIIDTDNYRVPHPGLHRRDFVLAPLAEIAADVVHPVLGQTIAALRNTLDLSQIKPFALRPLQLGSRWFHWGRQTYVMGILNVTPDSFSGDGLLKQADWLAATVERGRAMIGAGAHVIDVGGESTRPGSSVVAVGEELDRVIPAIEALSRAGIGPISIDTYKAEVARQALEAGAALVNDVWGLRRDLNMAALIAQRHVPVIVMHNRSKPQDAAFEARLGGRYTGSHYDDLIPDIQRELLECVDLARQAGVPDHHLILDTGIGFGKTVPQNLELLDRTGDFRALGWPILIGPSRKSFIGYTLDLPPDQRIEGTAAAVAVGIARGADLVRVHDVEIMARVAKMTDAIVRRRELDADKRG
ncbi:MAG: dihydropteroate synthase [Thermoflexales bacterium]|nr:dihydropteroate synthase [Thermoflexales bacterium]